MRASRLLSILMLLQTRGRMSARALADVLEVSMRTVYRDADHLSAAGVPIHADTGRNGGLSLQAGWRTQLTGLTVPEARAVFMAGLPGPAAELGLGEAMASAQLKLMAALPADWRADNLDQVARCFHLDPADWYHRAAPTPYLQAVAGAVWSRRRLAMRYESWQAVAERRVEPLGLVLKSGVWYLVARSARPDGAAQAEPHIHRMASIQSLQVLDDSFAPPRGFDLPAWWAAATARFEDSVYRASARLLVTEDGLAQLQHFATRVAEAALDNARPSEREGWAETEIPIESVAHAARELLRLGERAEVLAPAALRRALGRELARAAARYAAA